MFLFIMLSFAIISEVSAVSDAEISGTGHGPSIETNIINHNITGGSGNVNFMQNHENGIGDSYSHNEQKSFDQSPSVNGDRNSNENLYEHEGDFKSNGEKSLDYNKASNYNQNKADEFKANDKMDYHCDNNPMDLPRDFGADNQKAMDLPSDITNQKNMNIPIGNISFGNNNQKPMDLPRDNFTDMDGQKHMDVPRDNFSGVKPMGNMSDMMPMDVPMGNMSDMRPMDVPMGNMSDVRPMDNFTNLRPMDLRDNNSTAVPNGEAMNNVMSKLIGLDRIAPIFNLSKNVKDPKSSDRDNNTRPDNNVLPMNRSPDASQNSNIKNSQNNKQVDDKSIRDKNTQNPVRNINALENSGNNLLNGMVKERAKL